jgi:hypothetical protein
MTNGSHAGIERELLEGGRCQLCGYDRFIGALSFHHMNPDTKRLPVSMSGVTLALDFLREEARRCVPLCANCHAEVEGGVSRVSLE